MEYDVSEDLEVLSIDEFSGLAENVLKKIMSKIKGYEEKGYHIIEFETRDRYVVIVGWRHENEDEIRKSTELETKLDFEESQDKLYKKTIEKLEK